MSWINFGVAKALCIPFEMALDLLRFEKLEKTLVRLGEPELAFECLTVKSKAGDLANTTHCKEHTLISKCV